MQPGHLSRANQLCSARASVERNLYCQSTASRTSDLLGSAWHPGLACANEVTHAGASNDVLDPGPDASPPARWTQIDVDYQNLRTGMQALSTTSGSLRSPAAA
jgi:hypothetical protein